MEHFSGGGNVLRTLFPFHEYLHPLKFAEYFSDPLSITMTLFSTPFYKQIWNMFRHLKILENFLHPFKSAPSGNTIENNDRTLIITYCSRLHKVASSSVNGVDFSTSQLSGSREIMSLSNLSATPTKTITEDSG